MKYSQYHGGYRLSLRKHKANQSSSLLKTSKGRKMFMKQLFGLLKSKSKTKSKSKNLPSRSRSYSRSQSRRFSGGNGYGITSIPHSESYLANPIPIKMYDSCKS